VTEEGPLISVRGLQKSFRAVQVLHAIDLDVARGEVVAIIGPSGSGKSTFIRCLNGLVKPDAGTLSVAGKAVDIHDERAWQALRVELGMVFQNYALFPHLTVLRNVTLAPVRRGRCDPAAAETQARQLLARIGLGHKVDSYPAELSGGQQQRVAIVRALAMAPQAILFDEPTSALDPETIADVLDVMRQLARKGTTMVVVTHEMGFAREVADRVVFMAEGRIMEQGAPAELFDAPSHERTQRFLQNVRPFGAPAL
jgi:ABC-type polar amino acid transport system ATPase subunit